MNKEGLSTTELANILVEAISDEWYYAGSPLVHRPDLVIFLRDIILRVLKDKFVE